MDHFHRTILRLIYVVVGLMAIIAITLVALAVKSVSTPAAPLPPLAVATDAGTHPPVAQLGENPDVTELVARVHSLLETHEQPDALSRVVLAAAFAVSDLTQFDENQVYTTTDESGNARYGLMQIDPATLAQTDTLEEVCGSWNDNLRTGLSQLTDAYQTALAMDWLDPVRATFCLYTGGEADRYLDPTQQDIDFYATYINQPWAEEPEEPACLLPQDLTGSDMDYAGGRGHMLAIEVSGDWAVIPGADWLSCAVIENNGSALIFPYFAFNEDAGPRTGRLVLAGGGQTYTVEMTQQGFREETPVIATDETVLSFEASGDHLPLRITANTFWTVQPTAPWIHVDLAEGVGLDEITISVDANPGTPRRGGIEISDGVVKCVVAINQSGTERTAEFAWPVPSSGIITAYRYYASLGNTARRNGVHVADGSAFDISQACRKAQLDAGNRPIGALAQVSIVSVADGTVIAVHTACTHYKWGKPCGCGIPGYGSGNGILIQHANGYKSYYGHLDAVNVAVGQRVLWGQPIATMGNTGNASGSTGVHLHVKITRHNLGVDMLSIYPNARVPEGAMAPPEEPEVGPAYVPPPPAQTPAPSAIPEPDPTQSPMMTPTPEPTTPTPEAPTHTPSHSTNTPELPTPSQTADTPNHPAATPEPTPTLTAVSTQQPNPTLSPNPTIPSDTAVG